MAKYPDKDCAEIALMIGEFFLKKCNGFREDAEKLLNNIRITNIKLTEDGKRVIVETARPGLFIGRKGENINGIAEMLGKEIDIEESFCWSDVMGQVLWAPTEEERVEIITEAYYKNSYESKINYHIETSDL